MDSIVISDSEEEPTPETNQAALLFNLNISNAEPANDRQISFCTSDQIVINLNAPKNGQVPSERATVNILSGIPQQLMSQICPSSPPKSKAVHAPRQSDEPFTPIHLGTMGPDKLPRAHDTVRSSILLRQDFVKNVEQRQGCSSSDNSAESPSQKNRYELYSYLKLTTLGDLQSSKEKPTMKVQNRRSNRIKYLTKDGERLKESDKLICLKLPKENGTSNGEESVSEKSLKELGIDVSSLIDKSQKILYESVKKIPTIELHNIEMLRANKKRPSSEALTENKRSKLTVGEEEPSGNKKSEQEENCYGFKKSDYFSRKGKYDQFLKSYTRYVYERYKKVQEMVVEQVEVTENIGREEELHCVGDPIESALTMNEISLSFIDEVALEDDTKSISSSDNDSVVCVDTDEEEENGMESIGQPEIVNVAKIPTPTPNYVQVNRQECPRKSLRDHLLNQKSPIIRYNVPPNVDSPPWLSPTNIEKNHNKNQSHLINVSNENGEIMNLCYVAFDLVIVQENLVSFWTQSSLGNVLGSQGMWIPRGGVQRLILGSGCVRKQTGANMVMIVEQNSVIYVELWTKQHVFDKRERPVTDVFVTLYIRLHRGIVPHKKVLQLENINGYSKDVQYVVLKNSRNIIVSWMTQTENRDVTSHVHCYHLSPSFETVLNIRRMESVQHPISSLHLIDHCDDLIMGCGDNKISLWNVEQGSIILTINPEDVNPESRMLWTKNDRGFLFVLRHFEDHSMELLALNSYGNTWKRLRTYKPEFDDEENPKILQGVCLENGLLAGFYNDTVVIWNVDSTKIMNKYKYEDSSIFISGNYVCVSVKTHVVVSHHLQYLIVSVNP